MNKVVLKIFLLASIAHFSCGEVLVPSLEGRNFNLTSPESDVLLHSPGTFSWDRIEGATQYRVRVVSPSFDSLQTIAFDTITIHNRLELPLISGRYEWQVQALNEGSDNALSPKRKFICQ